MILWNKKKVIKDTYSHNIEVTNVWGHELNPEECNKKTGIK